MEEKEINSSREKKTNQQNAQGRELYDRECELEHEEEKDRERREMWLKY